MADTQILVSGLHFPEGPRWRDGWLWFSDMHAPAVKRVDSDGNLEVLFEVPTQPSGLGWLPDGRLLIVSMTDRSVLRQETNGDLVPHADLSAIATYHCNDMVVDSQGRAYVGNFGSDITPPASPSPASLALIHPDGRVLEAAMDLLFPNGMVLTPDEKTLVVGETFGGRLTAFDVALDGTLSGRRVWAQVPGMVPDGCCLDAEGAIWVASPFADVGVLRILPDGSLGSRIVCSQPPFACMLGGEDRRTLFICTAPSADDEARRREAAAAIEIARVPVAGAGRP